MGKAKANSDEIRIDNVNLDVKRSILDKAEREGVSYSQLLKPELRILAEKYDAEQGRRIKN